MIYEQRKIVKKFQIAIRRSLFGNKVDSDHYIHNYIKRQELVDKLESYFLEEMSWENFGKVWEVSHIIPVTFFDHSKEEDLKFCWNVKNIIPMLKEDNKNFGSCLLFARMWFDSNKDKENYTEYIVYLDNKMPIYSKYLTNEKFKTK